MTCFLPCRQGSERVLRKNIRPFGGFRMGLLEIKLSQLEATDSIDRVVLSTNDPEIIDFAESSGIRKLKVVRRAESLSGSQTSTDELMEHVLDVVDDEHVLWTHVTSPFVNAREYGSIIDAYYAKADEGYDSLMTVSVIRGFVWDDERPLNYDRVVEKWPRTQTLKSLYEVNSAAFICSRDNYRERNDRIGERPYMFRLGRVAGFDIDWMEDLHLAEALLTSGQAEV